MLQATQAFAQSRAKAIMDRPQGPRVINNPASKDRESTRGRSIFFSADFVYTKPGTPRTCTLALSSLRNRVSFASIDTGC